MKAEIIGTHDYGWCGIVPLIRVHARKPAFRNNGFACYSGLPKLNVPGLKAALPDGGQGHVMLTFDCGGTFGTYASQNYGNDNYQFS